MTVNLSYFNTSLEKLPALFPVVPKENEEWVYFINGSFHPSNLVPISQTINSASGIVLVDGGTNHFYALLKECEKQKIILTTAPVYLVGDMDSVDEGTLQEILRLYPKLEVIKFRRDKDHTDLEGALKLIKIDYISRITILSALGGRVDHTIGNMFYLFRDKFLGKVRFLSYDNKRFVVVSPDRPAVLENSKNQYVSLVPLYGSTHGCLVHPATELQKRFFNTYVISDDRAEISSLNEKVLCIFHGDKAEYLPLPEKGEYKYEFNREGKILEDLQILFHCASFPGRFTVTSDTEKVFAIPPGVTFSFEVIKGQTISLIPIGGPATGINTNGLFWELKEGVLDCDFIGISNIALKETVTISIKNGSLLCFVNHFIDQDMLQKANL